jgi:hypothetical protein
MVQQQLLNALGQLAVDYRAASSVGDEVEKARITKVYLDQLAQLLAAGWVSTLGETRELPDCLLPEEYLARRSKILGDLEDRLGELAMGLLSGI